MKISAQLSTVILLAATASARPLTINKFIDYGDLSQSQQNKLSKFEGMEQGNPTTITTTTPPTTNYPTTQPNNNNNQINTDNFNINIPDVSSAITAGREAVQSAMAAIGNINWKRMVFNNFVNDYNDLSQSQQNKFAQFEAVERGQGPISQWWYK
ncbi:hypothetical protein TWF281_007727 [Arthrobotrys megalospora]